MNSDRRIRNIYSDIKHNLQYYFLCTKQSLTNARIVPRNPVIKHYAIRWTPSKYLLASYSRSNCYNLIVMKPQILISSILKSVDKLNCELHRDIALCNLHMKVPNVPPPWSITFPTLLTRSLPLSPNLKCGIKLLHSRHQCQDRTSQSCLIGTI